MMAEQLIKDVLTHLPRPILKFMSLAINLCAIVGVYLVAYNGSDDSIIEGLDKVDDDAAMEEIIDTNQENLHTVLKNQKRMYAIQKSEFSKMRGLLYKGIGIIISLMTALMGLVGAVIVL